MMRSSFQLIVRNESINITVNAFDFTVPCMEFIYACPSDLERVGMDDGYIGRWNNGMGLEI